MGTSWTRQNHLGNFRVAPFFVLLATLLSTIIRKRGFLNGPATSSAPKARLIRLFIGALNSPVFGHNASVEMPSKPLLRLKICNSPECRASFTICISCDRGQRYCSESCRDSMRRRQRRAADNRYQRTEQGRLAHRCRQRRYRQRPVAAAVTDQGCNAPASTKAPATVPLRQCRICGEFSPWMDPFPAIPRRWWRVGRRFPPNAVQKTTLSDDR